MRKPPLPVLQSAEGETASPRRAHDTGSRRLRGVANAGKCVLGPDRGRSDRNPTRPGEGARIPQIFVGTGLRACPRPLATRRCGFVRHSGACRNPEQTREETHSPSCDGSRGTKSATTGRWLIFPACLFRRGAYQPSTSDFAGVVSDLEVSSGGIVSFIQFELKEFCILLFLPPKCICIGHYKPESLREIEYKALSHMGANQFPC